jgi:hypothetical protein
MVLLPDSRSAWPPPLDCNRARNRRNLRRLQRAERILNSASPPQFRTQGVWLHLKYEEMELTEARQVGGDHGNALPRLSRPWCASIREAPADPDRPTGKWEPSRRTVAPLQHERQSRGQEKTSDHHIFALPEDAVLRIARGGLAPPHNTMEIR